MLESEDGSFYAEDPRYLLASEAFHVMVNRWKHQKGNVNDVEYLGRSKNNNYLGSKND